MKKAFMIIFILIQVSSISGCGNVPDTTSTEEGTQMTTSETNEEVTTTVQEESMSTDNKPSENETTAEIILDKTYHNERFGFEFKYPGVWSLVEESNSKELPDHGAFIFIDNNETSIDYQNLPKKNYIHIFGQISSVNIPVISLTVISEFTTDSGLMGKNYFYSKEDRCRTDIVFKQFFGASVYVSKELNDKYGDVITRILKSIKLP